MRDLLWFIGGGTIAIIGGSYVAWILWLAFSNVLTALNHVAA